jgi:hypothetical protein
MLIKVKNIKNIFPGAMAQGCNPSYSDSRYWKDLGPPWPNNI